MVRSVKAALQQHKIAFDSIGRDVASILTTRIFLWEGTHLTAFAIYKGHYGALLAESVPKSAADAFLFRAYPRLINFYDTAQLVDHWVLRHRKSNSVKHKPRTAIRNFLAVEGLSHPKELVGAHALLAAHIM